jgi:hypothetical protein
MMKTYIKSIGYFVIATMLLHSCSDFLELDPKDNLSSETFWKSSKDVQGAVAATYVRYRSTSIGGMGAGNGSFMDHEVFSDNGHSGSGFLALQNVARGGISSAQGGIVFNLWRDAWQGIAYCNYFLDNIDRTKDFLADEDFKRYKGEVLFNRCFFYNELAQFYGDLPLVLTSVSSSDPYKDMPREPKATIVAQLLQDIDEAIAGLPNIPYTDGHAVRGSAIMLKVRILMNNGRFAEAAETAGAYINGPDNVFELADSYDGIFFGKQKDNPEIMFSVQYSSPDDLHQTDQYTGSRMSPYPLADFVNTYEEKSPGVMDPRMGMTIFKQGDPWVQSNDGLFPPPKTASNAEGRTPWTGYAWRKYVDTSLIQARNKISSQHGVLMRYADLLLLYAEAVVTSGTGDRTLALKALNDVRGRVGVEMPPISDADFTVDRVRKERRIELAYEGDRYNDLIRWGIAEEVITNKVYDENGNKCKFNGWVWPVPQGVMDIMAPLWEQNTMDSNKPTW